HRLHAETLRVVGDALRVVACAGRHHPAAPLLRPEQGELVRRPALLEGSGALQALQLEVDRRAAQVAEGPRPRAWGRVDVGADALGGGEDVLERHHGAGRVAEDGKRIKPRAGPGRGFRRGWFASARVPFWPARPTVAWAADLGCGGRHGSPFR